MFGLLKEDTKIIIFSLLIAVLLFLIDLSGALIWPKGALQQIFTPIQYGLYKTSSQFTRQFEFIVLARRASQENKALSEQLAQVLSENSQLQKKLAETQSLLAQQTTLDVQTFALQAARPIGFSRFLIIDKGESDGLKVGQTVIYKDNYIGQIKEVSPRRSIVSLATDPDTKIAAFVINNNGRAQGILLGQFGSEMLLDKVIHEEPMEKNDLVYTGGTEENIPRGLIIGRVEETVVKDGEVFKQAKVKPIFNLGNLDLLFVITN
jgi:rod shape-determining protein MreC